MSAVFQDLRFGVRLLFKSPGLSGAVILALALGIGANTAMFSVVYGVLLNALPYRAPQRLAVVSELDPRGSLYGAASANYLDWAAQSKTFEGIAGWVSRNAVFQGAERRQTSAGFVTTNFFDVLGSKPSLGRTFLPDEGGAPSSAGPPRVAVISQGLWKAQFGGDPNILGRTVTFDKIQYSVIGVMPPEFKFISRRNEAWIPIALDPEDREYHYLVTVARLKEGRSLTEAAAEMALIASRMESSYAKTNRGWKVELQPLSDFVVEGSLRRTLWLLLTAVGFVLLIACVNIASLLLSRSSARMREIAIRTSLGASRARVLQQLLTESMVLSLAGGSLGLAIAWVLVKNAPKFLPRFTLPASTNIELNYPVMAFTLLVSIATGILFGLAPAFQAARGDLQSSLKDGSRSVTAGKGGGRLRGALLVGEIAITIILLIGASLMVQGLRRLQTANLGFNPDRVLLVNLTLQPGRYSESSRVVSFHRQALDLIRSLPGVRAAAVASNVPMQRNIMRVPIEPEAALARDSADLPDVNFQMISPDYMKVLGIPILRGRGLTDEDGPSSAPVALVNEAFARQYFPGGAVGSSVRVSAPLLGQNKLRPLAAIQIVGVIGDVRSAGISRQGRSGDLALPANPEIYVPYTQVQWSEPVYFAIQTIGSPAAMTAAVKAGVESVDPGQPVTRVNTMEAILSDVTSEPRFRAQLMGVFSALALLLAVIGIYAVTSFAISQRTQEFGIRMALGASPPEILRIAMGPVVTLAAVGIAIGIAGSLALSQAVRGFLYGVSATDPATIVGSSLLLAMVALVAGLIPARQASRLNPANVLRPK